MVDAITGGTEGAQAMQQAMQEAQHVTAELREKVEHIADGIAAMQSMPPEQKGAMLADLTFDYYTGAVAAKAGGIAAKLAKRAVGLGAAAKEAGVAGTLAREAEAAAAKAAHAARETEAATAGCVGPQKPKMPGKGTFAAEAPAAAEAPRQKFKPTGKTEVILPKVKTFEQARNKAFDILGNSLGQDSAPYRCTLEKSQAFGKIVGRTSADKQIRWRLDWDPMKGPHIHVEDFSGGKSLNAVKYAIPFDGDEETFLSLLRNLNR